jgi:hypothetical protein
MKRALRGQAFHWESPCGTGWSPMHLQPPFARSPASSPSHRLPRRSPTVQWSSPRLPPGAAPGKKPPQVNRRGPCDGDGEVGPSSIPRVPWLRRRILSGLQPCHVREDRQEQQRLCRCSRVDEKHRTEGRIRPPYYFLFDLTSRELRTFLLFFKIYI